MSDEATKQELECPHCKGKVPFALVSRFANQSRIAFRLVPAPGELLQADTVGSTVVNLQKVLEASGRHVGVPTVVLVEGVDVDGEGGITFKLLVSRYEAATERKARMKKRKGKLA